MRTITVTRKRSFASALMPYWVIVSDTPKMKFMEAYFMVGNLCDHDRAGRPIPRIDTEVLDRIGYRIANGKTMEIPVREGSISVFVSAVGGSFSNELLLEDIGERNILITTKGGWNSVSYPHIEII